MQTELRTATIEAPDRETAIQRLLDEIDSGVRRYCGLTAAQVVAHRQSILDRAGRTPAEIAECCENCGDEFPRAALSGFPFHPKCAPCRQAVQDADRFSGAAYRGF